jgi:hypothetical protein
MVKIISIFHGFIPSFLTIAFVAVVAACNEPSNGTGAGGTDTSEGVITTPPHDTTSVVTPPPTNDSNVVNTDSMGMSR